MVRALRRREAGEGSERGRPRSRAAPRHGAGRSSPWEYRELHDDRVTHFARVLWTGAYTASYVARATLAGNFVAPPAYAEEMYNPALQGCLLYTSDAADERS